MPLERALQLLKMCTQDRGSLFICISFCWASIAMKLVAVPIRDWTWMTPLIFCKSQSSPYSNHKKSDVVPFPESVDIFVEWTALSSRHGIQQQPDDNCFSRYQSMFFLEDNTINSVNWLYPGIEWTFWSKWYSVLQDNFKTINFQN